jgi:predicted acetyltransferase
MPDFSALDYVLRPNGWLDTFPESPSTHRFAVVIGGLLVGFTMLVGLDKEQAEFYIAIHPEHTGEGTLVESYVFQLGRQARQ